MGARGGENNPNWKGDTIGYSGLHQRLRKQRPSPGYCECCGVAEEMKPDALGRVRSSLDLAFTNGHGYNVRGFGAMYLCRKCHRALDFSGEKHPMLGKRRSPETCAKISAGLSGENHYLFGTHPSDETRSKMSAAQKAYHARKKAGV